MSSDTTHETWDASIEPPHPPPPQDHLLLTSTPQSLHRAVYARRAEYVRPHRIRVKVGSWNVAACPGTDKDLSSWFVAGKGVDKRLAGLTKVSPTNRAIEREDTADSLDHDPNAVRLVGGDKIGLYVLGLQEVVDLNAASQYISRAYSAGPGGLSAVERWTLALESALPRGYERVCAEQMSGLLILIYASPEVFPAISHVSVSSVGTGLMGYMGNKGAVSTRIVLGETTRMAFVNCHLASGNEQTYLDRRCWDVNQILSRTNFAPFNPPGADEVKEEKIGDEDFAFWFGDLNFRLDGIPGDDIRRILTLHTRGEYGPPAKNDGAAEDEPIDGEAPIVLKTADSSDDDDDDDDNDVDNDVSRTGSPTTRSMNTADTTTTASSDHEADESSISLPDPDDFPLDPSDDPASLQATLDSLLPHDQLRRMIRKEKVFHDGWREGPISFLPSYKYDVGTVGLFDTSEKRRAPSWCDRILYRTRKDRLEYEKKAKEKAEAKKKDDEMKARGMEHAGDDDQVLFDYDPDNDGEESISKPVAAAPIFDYDEEEDGDDDAAAIDAEEVVTKEGFVDRLNLDIYTSHQRVQSSDHKPIISIFTLDYDAVVPDLKAHVHAEVARELDRAENEGRPGITIVIEGSYGVSESGSSEAVDFGVVEFLRKKTASLTIANTGQVAASFAFVEKPSTEEIEDLKNVPRWLKTTFFRSDHNDSGVPEAIDTDKEVVLEPGDTVSAQLEVLVEDPSLVRMLNDGQCRLEDVLVLRVTDGRDHFVPVRGAWAPTCFARSIDELIRVPEGGIRAFVQSAPQSKSIRGSIPYDLEVHRSAPKELFKLLEALESLTERVVADEVMLEEHHVPREKAAWPLANYTCSIGAEQLASIVAALDEDKPVIDALEVEASSMFKLEAVAQVLVLFLQSLTDGLITVPLWTKIEQSRIINTKPPASSDSIIVEEEKTAVLDILSSAPHHNISFVFLTTTLAKVIADLCPLTKPDADAVAGKPSGRGGLGSIGRRSLSFMRVAHGGGGGGSSSSSHSSSSDEAQISLDRRRAKEASFAEILGRAVCRTAAAVPSSDKERRALEDRQRAVMRLFLRRREEV